MEHKREKNGIYKAERECLIDAEFVFLNEFSMAINSFEMVWLQTATVNAHNTHSHTFYSNNCTKSKNCNVNLHT